MLHRKFQQFLISRNYIKFFEPSLTDFTVFILEKLCNFHHQLHPSVFKVQHHLLQDLLFLIPFSAL